MPEECPQEPPQSIVEGEPSQKRVESFGDSIRRLCQDSGMNQTQIAEKSDVTTSTIRRWLKMKHPPTNGPFEEFLNVLGVTDPKEIIRLLHGLPPKRSARGARKLAQEAKVDRSTDLDMANLMPNAGDLWQALREKRRMSARALAAEIGVHPSQVTRWEHNEAVVSPDRRKRIYEVLEASNEEKQLLEAMADKLFPGLGAYEDASLDKLEAAVVSLTQQVLRGEPGLTPLHFLPVEAAIWTHALKVTSARTLYARACATHSELLDRQERRAEMRVLAERIMTLQPRVVPLTEDWWATGVAHAARVLEWEAQKRNNPNGWKKIGRFINRHMKHFKGLQQCALHRDLARSLAAEGATEGALGALGEAQELAQQFDETGWSGMLCSFLAARFLTEAGDFKEAARVMPPVCDPTQDEALAMRQHRAWTRLLLEAGDKSRAAEHLQAYRDLAADLTAPVGWQDAEALAARL